MLNFLPLHVSCIFHVSDPLEKQWTLFIFCISLTKLGSQVGGAQIRRALIRYSVVFLVHFRGKKATGEMSHLAVWRFLQHWSQLLIQ